MNLLQFVATAAAVAGAVSAVMVAAWWIQWKTGNPGWTDTCWTGGVGAVGVAAALLPPADDGAPDGRQLLVAALAAIWSVRLCWHIAVRTRASGDDPRYRNLIIQWGSDWPRQMFWFLQSQAAVGLLLALSIALAAHTARPTLAIQDLLGVAILAIGIAGEALADHQLRTFKSNPANHGSICDAGLWAWSRHPNYFFEWVVWLAYPVIAIDTAGNNPFGWLALVAPVSMYWVLVHVSGIPPLEDHMVRTRGDAFRAYQRRTRAFVPLPLLRKPSVSR